MSTTMQSPATYSKQQQLIASSQELPTRKVKILIVGAGPAGLRAAKELAQYYPDQVLVVDRESAPGGIPRHSDHIGYGMRDLYTITSGPKYAKIISKNALKAGAEILCNTAVTGWAGERSVFVTSAEGRSIITADCIILATGTRERPRSARLIPGDRTSGVYTTGLLQNSVHIKHQEIGKKAVILGAELVSWSAVMTLAEAGCKTVALVTKFEKPDAYAPVTLAGKILSGAKVHTNTRISKIIGKPRVTAVELENLSTGEKTVIECDTVVTSADWIPDNELARSLGLAIAPGSKAPVADADFRTARPGVFAIGNLVHPADMHDICALDGKKVKDSVLDWLGTPNSWSAEEESSALIPGDSVQWVSPARFKAGQEPTRNRISLWTKKPKLFPLVTAKQNGVVIGKARLLWPTNPGRVTRVPARILKKLNPSAGPVEFELG